MSGATWPAPAGEAVAGMLAPVLAEERERMTYRERREARADRLERWAESRSAKSVRAFESARALGDMIPMGQPILLGHHSEGRHRRDLARIDSSMRRGVENERKADGMVSRAVEIRRQADSAVYSDDVDACDRLRVRIAERETELAEFRSFNAAVKRAKGDNAKIAEAINAHRRAGREYLGWVRAFAFAIGKPVPLTNKTAALRKDRARLEELEHRR